MSIYPRLRDNTAKPLIKKFGQTMTLRAPGGETFNPATGAYTPTYTETSCYGVVDTYSTTEVDGTLIQQGDRQVIIADATPKVNDKLVIAGVEYSVISVDPVSPGGTDVMYTVQVRR